MQVDEDNPDDGKEIDIPDLPDLDTKRIQSPERDVNSQFSRANHD